MARRAVDLHEWLKRPAVEQLSNLSGGVTPISSPPQAECLQMGTCLGPPTSFLRDPPRKPPAPTRRGPLRKGPSIHSSSPSSLPLAQPSWYSSAISANSLLRLSRSSIPIDRTTLVRNSFNLCDTELSVDKAAVTFTDPCKALPSSST